MKIATKIARQDDGTYKAVCPMLPGCVAQGCSAEDAMEKIELAVRGYLASLNVALPERMNQLTAVAN